MNSSKLLKKGQICRPAMEKVFHAFIHQTKSPMITSYDSTSTYEHISIPWFSLHWFGSKIILHFFYKFFLDFNYRDFIMSYKLAFLKAANKSWWLNSFLMSSKFCIYDEQIEKNNNPRLIQRCIGRLMGSCLVSLARTLHRGRYI